jgi:hypothetical protein
VWVEKDGMANFLIDTTAHLRMPVYVNKGYGSATVIKDAAERYGNGKGWTLLYIGDFDPSGLDIERNMCDILSSHRCHPEIVRVSLTLEGTRALPQVAALDIKAKDTRSKKFWERYGREQKGYEVDAVPASQLQRMLLEKIHTYIDVSALNDALKLESMVQAEASKKLENAMSRFGNTILKSGIAECNLPYHKQMLYLADQKEL